MDYLEIFCLYPRYYQPTYALEQSCRFVDVCAIFAVAAISDTRRGKRHGGQLLDTDSLSVPAAGAYWTVMVIILERGAWSRIT